MLRRSRCIQIFLLNPLESQNCSMILPYCSICAITTNSLQKRSLQYLTLLYIIGTYNTVALKLQIARGGETKGGYFFP